MNDEREASSIGDALSELVRRRADGTATRDDVARLAERLRDDPAARKFYRDYLALDAALERAAAGRDASAEPVAVDSSSRDAETRDARTSSSSRGFARSTARLGLTALAAAAVALLAVAVSSLVRGDAAPWGTILESGPGVRIESAGAWRPARPGDSLRAGEAISVADDATARVRLPGLGATTLGPSSRLRQSTDDASFELVSGFAGIAFDEGSRAPSGAPWRIRTPQAEAAGTGERAELGDAAEELDIATAEGRTVIRVAGGRVRLTSLDDGAVRDVTSGGRAVIGANRPTVVSANRSGSALVITSRRPHFAEWERFNRLIGEKLVGARLWRLGFRVDSVDYEDVRPSDLVGRALVILSFFEYGVGEPALKRIELARADVPVICLEPVGYPVLGMTAPEENVGFGFQTEPSPVEFVAPEHPLSAGIAGTRDAVLRGLIGWGRPLESGVLVAHLPGHRERALIFGYDARARLDGFAAPARRVGLFIDPFVIGDESEEAWKLLEAAVEWAVAVESET